MPHVRRSTRARPRGARPFDVAYSEWRPPRFLTREELARLLDTCRATAPRWYLFVLTLARTGMRLGETCALQWRDVDLQRRVAIVQRAFWRGQVQSPKSGRVRHVDLS